MEQFILILNSWFLSCNISFRQEEFYGSVYKQRKQRRMVLVNMVLLLQREQGNQAKKDTREYKRWLIHLNEKLKGELRPQGNNILLIG